MIDIGARAFIDSENQRVARLEMSKPIARALVEDITDHQIRGEVNEAVRHGLKAAHIPPEIQTKLDTWSKLIIELDERAESIRAEQSDLFDRQNELWKTGGATAAVLEALDNEEARLRAQFASNREHLGNAQERLDEAKKALTKHLQQEARRIAQEQVEFNQTELKCIEGLEAFIAKNEVALVSVCRKRFAQYLYGNRQDSFLSGVESFGELRANELIATPEAVEA